ncbi:YceI family protein [Larkinella humicola]|uniref:YceI family protein n=1 Tax=Larkinella humicola TaxID=2607654 RepID=A0A5N1JML2_9BACT|nr:YceI family protein [Larkinella humicola]KAA9355203.1 YceI family protein [Larkinella humicola]
MKKVRLFCAIALSSFLLNCTKDHLDPSQEQYQLDEKTSVAVWKGSLRTGYFEEGSIAVTSDALTVKDGKVTGGSFTIPVSSIVSTSLPDTLKPVLVHHLQSADFFNMALHPSITYTITSLEPYAGGEGVAGANYRVNGSLTMLGKTHPVNFPAKIALKDNQLAVEATLKVDRTQWGMTYSADPALPDAQYILPEIAIHLKLAGNKH